MGPKFISFTYTLECSKSAPECRHVQKYKTNSERQIRMTDAATYQAIPLIYCTVIGRGYFNPPVMSKQYDLPLLRC